MQAGFQVGRLRFGPSPFNHINLGAVLPHHESHPNRALGAGAPRRHIPTDRTAPGLNAVEARPAVGRVARTTGTVNASECHLEARVAQGVQVVLEQGFGRAVRRVVVVKVLHPAGEVPGFEGLGADPQYQRIAPLRLKFAVLQPRTWIDSEVFDFSLLRREPNLDNGQHTNCEQCPQPETKARYSCRDGTFIAGGGAEQKRRADSGSWVKPEKARPSHPAGARVVTKP